MNEKPNYDELAERLDFGKLARSLGEMSARDNPRRKTIRDLLDKVRGEILAAHQRGASCRALAKALTSGGLRVSEGTLRKYLQAQGVKLSLKRGRSIRRKNGSPPAMPAASAAANN